MAQPEITALNARRMLDQYEIVAEIASGGMGTVYLARLARAGGFQRMVALKLLHRLLAEETHFVSMLLDEARLAARLHHPNAVGILDVKQSELGYYMVMDYVDGFSMDDVLDRSRSHVERMKLGVRILIDASTGLDAAHRLTDDDGRPLQIVHRDVSPQNILVGRDGSGRITDFGVARAAERITASRPGTIKGKPCYMAPEQAECRELDARADLFALGIVLWETLTGQLLFESDAGTMSILLAVLQRPIQPPSMVCPEVPLALERVCMRALERDVTKRYQTGREFIDALTEAAARSNMLVGAHEVSDAIREIFSADLDARQASVRAHVSAIEKLPVTNMTLGDLYSIPRLGSAPEMQALRSGVRDSNATSDQWFETARSGEARVDPTSQTIALASAPDRETVASPKPVSSRPSAPASARAPASPQAWKVALISLLLGALIAVGGLLAWRMNQPLVVEPPASVAAPSVPPTPAEPSPAPAALAPAVAEAPTPAPAAVPAAAEAAAPEPAPAPEATEQDPSRSGSTRPRRERATGMEGTDAPAAVMTPAPTTIESNPYTH